MHVRTVTTAFRHRPVGVDDARPRVDWQLASDAAGAIQRAYEVRLLHGGDQVWTSERHDARRQWHRYDGPALAPLTRYQWQVRVWYGDGQVSDWSEPAPFVSGMLDRPWDAQWVGYGVRMLHDGWFLRRRLELAKPVAEAFLCVTARGLVEPWLDGERITDERLLPGWTEYLDRINYRVFDVTDRLSVGEHMLGAIATGGWWHGQVGNHPGGRYGDRVQILAHLLVRHDDGTETVITTDDAWQVRTGGIQQASIMHGEHVDARLWDDDWCRVDGAEDRWTEVTTQDMQVVERCRRQQVHKSPPILSAHPGEPIRVLDELPAQRVSEPLPGMWLVDFGQNIAGVVRLRVNAPTGTVVRLRHGEMMNPDGTLYVENLRSALAVDVYTCRGGGEVIEPGFTFHGFRYCEISGLPAKPDLADCTAVVIGSDTPEAARFSCSNPMLEQLWRNTRWTMRANFIDIPTDCPQRDERFGWTGDAQVFARTAIHMADVRSFFAKWLVDLADDQREDGSVSNFVPGMGLNSHAGAAWGDVVTVIPSTVAHCYDEPELLAAWAPHMQRWCDWLETGVDEDGLQSQGQCFGDWLALDHGEPGMQRAGATPKPLIKTAWYAESCRLAADACAAAGDTQAASELRTRRERLATAFRKHFVTDDGRMSVNTQTACLLALGFDLLLGEQRPTVRDQLIADIRQHDLHLTTGFVGVNLLLPVLAAEGAWEEVYAILEQESFPSWGYSIANGATTIWERWNGWVAGQGPGDPDMNSYSHYAYGSVCAFIADTVCGLDAAEPGFRLARIAPRPGGSLTHASYDHRACNGDCHVSWRQTDGGYAYEIAVPPNAEADCDLPLGAASDLRVSVGDAPVGGACVEDGHWRARLGSGSVTLVPVG